MHFPSKNECNRRGFDETKYMFSLIKNDELLEKVSNSIKKNLIVNLHIIKNI